MKPERQRGVALVSALALIALMLPLASQVQLQAKLEALIAGNSRHQSQAFYSAESGVALALETLASGIDAAALDAGPDGVDGTGDDGRFPFPPGHANEFPTGDYEFEVGVRHLGDGQIELVSRAVGPRNIARTVRAVVELPTALGAPPEVLGWQEIR